MSQFGAPSLPMTCAASPPAIHRTMDFHLPLFTSHHQAIKPLNYLTPILRSKYILSAPKPAYRVRSTSRRPTVLSTVLTPIPNARMSGHGYWTFAAAVLPLANMAVIVAPAGGVLSVTYYAFTITSGPGYTGITIVETAPAAPSAFAPAAAPPTAAPAVIIQSVDDEGYCSEAASP
jgi:hypothetical protein